MTFDLSDRLRDELENLRFECIYFDTQNPLENRFIEKGRIKAGVKTLADLVAQDLAVRNDFDCYRITPKGIEALNSKQEQSKVASRPKRLKTVEPQVRDIPNRLKTIN